MPLKNKKGIECWQQKYIAILYVYLSNGASNPAGINKKKIRGTNDDYEKNCEKACYGWMDAQTVNVGGEDDGVA